MTQIDYYAVLGVEETAAPQEIKAAFRKLAFEYHPDRTQGNSESADKMKALNEAYAVLSNEAKRQKYDSLRLRFGASAAGEFRKTYSQQDIFSGSDIHQIFEEMARSFGLRGFEDIFKEFYGNGQNAVPGGKPGTAFGGIFFSGNSGSARPDGIDRLLSGRDLGKLPRMLFEKITGTKLPKNGADQTDTIAVTSDEAALGKPYAYFHRKQSKRLVVRLPPGIKHGRRIRLAGMGEPGIGGGLPGDLYLKIRVKWSLREKVKSLIAAAFRGQ